MRYALFIAAAVMALTAVAPVEAEAYQMSQHGQASRPANVRSGPSNSYEIIGKIGAGEALQIVGCSLTWEWCDVKSRNVRGWVAARFLLGRHENHLAAVITHGPRMGVNVIPFDQGAYWAEHYSHTYFYKKRYGLLGHYAADYTRPTKHWHGWRETRVVPGTTVHINE